MTKTNVIFASKCAWRAVYIRRGTDQVFSLGIDPTASVPSIFGNILGWRFRIKLPLILWGSATDNALLLVLYKCQQRLLYAIDGRF